MTADIDIYRASKLYIDQHGDLASFEAGMRADALLDAGDLDGLVVWKKILKAIKVMQATPTVFVNLCRLLGIDIELFGLAYD